MLFENFIISLKVALISESFDGTIKFFRWCKLVVVYYHIFPNSCLVFQLHVFKSICYHLLNIFHYLVLSIFHSENPQTTIVLCFTDCIATPNCKILARFCSSHVFKFLVEKWATCFVINSGDSGL